MHRNNFSKLILLRGRRKLDVASFWQKILHLHKYQLLLHHRLHFNKGCIEMK